MCLHIWCQTCYQVLNNASSTLLRMDQSTQRIQMDPLYLKSTWNGHQTRGEIVGHLEDCKSSSKGKGPNICHTCELVGTMWLHPPTWSRKSWILWRWACACELEERSLLLEYSLLGREGTGVLWGLACLLLNDRWWYIKWPPGAGDYVQTDEDEYKDPWLNYLSSIQAYWGNIGYGTVTVQRQCSLKQAHTSIKFKERT